MAHDKWPRGTKFSRQNPHFLFHKLCNRVHYKFPFSEGFADILIF